MIDFGHLLDVAIDRIKPCLPEFHEIDDVSWGEDAFQLHVIDAEKFPGRTVDRFLFIRNPGESDDDVMERFNEAVAEYARSWR